VFVKLNGMPYQNGRKMGLHSKNILKKRILQVESIRKAGKVSSRTLSSRVKEFTSLLLKVSPHWLDEIKGQSETSGLDMSSLVGLNCLPDGFFSNMSPGPVIDTSQNCSSFFLSEPSRNILFKIRDEKNFPQSFLVLHSRGFYSSQAGRDIGNAGFAHFFNEKALAGANNTGSHTSHPTERPLFNDCHVMRYVSERAGSVREIPGLIENLIEKKAMGGANGERGAIFLFADPVEGLLVECDSRDYTARFISKGKYAVTNHYTTAKARKWESLPPGNNTLTRRKRLRDLLSKSGGILSPERVCEISRDTKNHPDSLCKRAGSAFFTTVSVQCQFIDRKNISGSINLVSCGNPLTSVFLPLALPFERTFVPALSGDYYMASEAAGLTGDEAGTSRVRHPGWEISAFDRTGEAGALWEEAYLMLKRRNDIS